jgi:hypothetical protein
MAFLAAASCYAADWYPVTIGSTWTYTGYFKSYGNVTHTAQASISDKEFIVDGYYYYFNIPDFDIRFYISVDETGAYMKLVRYPFPLFSFFSFDVIFANKLKFVSYPFVVGYKWHQETDAVAQIGPFTIKRKITADFRTASKEQVTVNGRTMNAFHVALDINEGDGHIKHENHWYIDGVGYYKGDTEEHYVQLQSYRFP